MYSKKLYLHQTNHAKIYPLYLYDRNDDVHFKFIELLIAQISFKLTLSSLIFSVGMSLSSDWLKKLRILEFIKKSKEFHIIYAF